MADNLVIVESPAKAKTIQKFLGKDYKVMSSYGHIRDLPKNDMNVDVEHGFAPAYEIPDDKRKVVNELKAAAAGADVVWLASDEDREGEAIAWHLAEVLALTPERTRRIAFHEITKTAILDAVKHPRSIDLNLVDAQQARRVLDRLVGYEISPVLWKKIKPELSAGRVQSVALRLIAERESEIESFKSEQYYRVTAQLLAGSTPLAAALNRNLASSAEAREFLEHCATATMQVAQVSVKPVRKTPAPPFTTSTLQQEAARKLGFSVSQTMRVAQALYEAGHITYMRTDSVNLSNLALGAIKQEITATDGARYYKARKFHAVSKGAQEAHEAIRPTYVSNHDIEGTAQEKRLYKLIWRRTVATQMADAEIERTTIDVSVSGRDEMLVATGEVVKFDGFLKVYRDTAGDDEQKSGDAAHELPRLTQGQALTAQEVVATQRFSQPPARYTEASLVHKLEELGIGRPSTYAPTISTIQDRKYVERGESKGHRRSYEVLTLTGGQVKTETRTETVGAEKGKLLITDIGRTVTDFLVANFPGVMDYNFTARVEENFDDIAQGKAPWNEEIGRFYRDLHPTVERVKAMHTDHKAGERTLGNDPATGEPVTAKIGRFGPVVQIGSSDDKDKKPRFASLQAGQSIYTITLDEALKLFELPRNLGEHEGQAVSVAVGRFGPYVKMGSTFASLPKGTSPFDVTLPMAVDLVQKKLKADAEKVIKTFDEEPELQVLNGRFGQYISYRKRNYKIPRTTDAASLTLDDCRAIVADEANATKPSARRRRAAAK